MATFLMLDIMETSSLSLCKNFYGWRYKYDNKNYEVVIKTLGPVHIGSGRYEEARLHL